MMKSRQSNLFLLELIIAIFFFAIASAICIQIFASAKQMTEKSKDLDGAINACVSVATILGSDGDALTLLQHQYPASEQKDDNYYLYFDANWLSCTAAEASFYVEVSVKSDSKNAGIVSFLIDCYPLTTNTDRTGIYSLPLKKALGGLQYE